MTRSFHRFDCCSEDLFGSLDSGEQATGLLIVSGGNEIRSGAHAGMSKLAHSVASHGFPVFRFDRRGIGDSSGNNQEFLSAHEDIKSAALRFRSLCPKLEKMVAFGNCDAATALAYFGTSASLDAYILANPWVIENSVGEDTNATVPNAAAIRSRYWARIKDPKSIVDLFSGKIDISKLFKGIKQAAKMQANTDLALRLRDSLANLECPTDILLANRDTTALAFKASWVSDQYKGLRRSSNISLSELDSASHSFADEKSKKWLETNILRVLEAF